MQAVRKAQTTDRRDEWLTLADAVALTGDSKRTWRDRAKREHFDAARCSRAPMAVKDGRAWMVSRRMDARLTLCPDQETRAARARDALLKRYPPHAVEAARRRFHWLRRWRYLIARTGDTERQCAEEVVREAYRVEDAGFKISLRTLQKWREQHDAIGPDGRILGLEALIDLRCLAKQCGTQRSPDAIEYFNSLYHTEAKHTARTCHEATAREAAREGWSWPVSYAATTRWLREYEDKAESCVHREGRTAYSKRYMPHVEIDYTVLEPGDCYVLDHSQCDFWCRYRGTHIRP